ncbi:MULTISPECIES: glycosyltransferase family 2 protein [Microbacterium]|uniref:glycosyltransferase family 2 protein n=1 Tax=Microbacterium TaxID=33882 RepID=UPI00214C7B62|nr:MULTISPECIES: glycosyltransferase family A protein [unclassified Microbacterium]MCR2814209.1 glycosyltransferase family 2 protein [Microbacterium sp. zg.Y1084]MDL5488219.1 glycosyltransferase family A protein [Microbacterium sp. zg-Y1211]
MAICIPTYRRPEDLARLLASLPAVTATAIDEALCREVSVVVVDNDPAGSAADVIVRTELPLRYLREATPGVAAVRNRALDEARDCDVVVFIDDDETPADPGWLAALLRTRRDHDADVVAGPVRTVVDGVLDPWVVAGGFFARAHRTHLQTGDAISAAASNNLLLDMSFVRQSRVRFDERFGRSGGEDSLFTSQLRARGARMVWCRDAGVLDHLPAHRQSRQHALHRTRGMAAAGVRVSLALAEDSRGRRVGVRARALAAALARMGSGTIRIAAATVSRSQGADAVGRRDLARGLGGIDGLAGRDHAYYGARAATAARQRQEEMT